ncbi:hypothetical protein HMPREF0765_4150 [Sphingobacterium spiritivorum ATCC 33300]|uniref:Uncharacterized protein n=1 Tax=Sphingobacterium spiritivorum ATCC 33300 TaxID=525372 RepID=C2G3J4_SPHSI|nr:hypothetical protein [Sphingobacterium spiritivorum]EEI90199.1 hypothetical protein HMPREF0765_4150 [Sphingobacterium spiritivorum ATCC 33300]QQS95164.1 hypothetical protein I6J03_17540 [Sphingobacterium spiritivorum]
MAGKGILLTAENNLLIISRRLVVGDSRMQEVALILQMNQGEQKFEPVLGANLIQYSKTKVKNFDIESRVKIHLALDDKQYDQIKQQIKDNV